MKQKATWYCGVIMILWATVLIGQRVEVAMPNAFAYKDWGAVGQGGGGNIVDVICHPTDPNIVWVVTDLTGIFRSMDGGVTYERMSGPIERKELLFEWMRGLDHELVYDLSDPNIMYWAMDGGIYTTPGLYKSTDGGESWFKIPGSPDLAPGAIVVDYNGVVYGVKHKNLYVSTDQGVTWLTQSAVPTYYDGDDYYWRRKFRIFMYVAKDNRVFIGDRRSGTGIFHTVDLGASWTNVLKGEEIMDVAASPTTPGLVVALEQDGRIFRSTDGGQSFDIVETIAHSFYKWGRWPAFYGGVAINKDDQVMVIGRHSLGISTDAGLTFSQFKENQPAWNPGDYIFPARRTSKSLFKTNKLAVSLASGHWYSVDGHVVKVSKDNGASWTGRCIGIDILCVYTPPVVDRTNPNIIHVGTGDNGHYYTTDLGRNWKTSEVRMQNVDGFAQDPNHPAVYYKMYGAKKDKGAIHKSTDAGVTWQKLTNIPLPGLDSRTDHNPSFVEGWIGRLRVDPTNSQRIFASHRASEGLYRSDDGGHTFSRVLKLQRAWEMEITDNGTVFICTFDSTGLYRSTNHGTSFEKIHDGMVHNFVVHPQNDAIIYVNAGSFSHAWASARVLTSYERNRVHKREGKGKLYKTTDGGKNWMVLGQYDGFALYIEPNYPNVMLMATRDGGQGIMRSIDGGVSWSSFHGSHDNYHPRGFVYGGVPGRVYSWNHNLSRIDGIHLNGVNIKDSYSKDGN